MARAGGRILRAGRPERSVEAGGPNDAGEVIGVRPPLGGPIEGLTPDELVSDPIQTFIDAWKLDPQIPDEVIEKISEKYGLDDPWYVRYATWVKGVVTGLDFGNYVPAVLTGRKFHDRNGDGVQDAGEEYLNGWEIQLYD